MVMVDGSELFDESVEHLCTSVCVWKQIIDSDGGTCKADNTSSIVVNDGKIVPDQCWWLWGIRVGIHCCSISGMCICSLSESGMEHAHVDVTGNEDKNTMFTTLARLMSEAKSIRMRNVQVLGCVPGECK